MKFLTENNAPAIVDEFVKNIPPYPNKYKGRGIVTCAGGVSYNTNAWVLIQQLRNLGCTLPIQVWYLGTTEYDERWEKLVKPLDVECVDAYVVREKFPHPRLNGYEVKPFAITHCPFEEVIFIDADNVPIVNPTFLFDTPQYKQHHALFWPDIDRLPKDHLIWKLAGNIPYRNEPAFESGQIVLNKKKCWKPLMLTNWYNLYSSFYYGYINGDKDTFHMAWRKLNVPYAMPSKGTTIIGTFGKAHAMFQYDFEGRAIFQHKTYLAKWNLFNNPHIPGFKDETKCFAYIKDLKSKWKVKEQGVKYCGTVLDANGYAAAARNYITALTTVGIEVPIQSIVFHGTTDLGQYADRIYPLIGKRYPYKTKIIHTLPHFFNEHFEEGIKNIGLTVWETTKLPQELVNHCNQMDEIWTATQWNAKIFKKSGVNVKIKVIPHSFPMHDRNIEFSEDDLDALCDKSTKGKYKFYCIFDWCARKNVEALLHAYFSEFNGNENVCLVMKVHIFNYDDQYKAIVDKINEIASKFKKHHPHISLIVNNLSITQIDGIHTACDCYVMPHRSEGWGIPIFEAMSFGNPAIATNFGGNLEYMTTKNSFLLNYTLTPVTGMPQFKWYDETQFWAEVEMDHLKSTMRWVYEHQEKAKVKGKQAIKDLQRFSWENIGKVMKECLK